MNPLPYFYSLYYNCWLAVTILITSTTFAIASERANAANLQSNLSQQSTESESIHQNLKSWEHALDNKDNRYLRQSLSKPLSRISRVSIITQSPVEQQQSQVTSESLTQKLRQHKQSQLSTNELLEYSLAKKKSTREENRATTANQQRLSEIVKSQQTDLIARLKRNSSEQLLRNRQSLKNSLDSTILVIDSLDTNKFSDTSWQQSELSTTIPTVSATDKLIAKLKTQADQTTIPASLMIAQSDSSGVVGDTFGEINKLRQQLLIDPIDPIIVKTKPPVASPSSSAGTPTGYGVGSRQAYIGGGLSFPVDDKRDRTDGSLSFGFGEGDPVRSLGIEFNFNLTSVGDASNFDFGDSGTIGFKLHRFIGRGTAVAFGWSNPIRWGDTDRSRPTLYGVVTKSIPLQPNSRTHKLPLTVSVGVGSGAFRSKGALEDGQDTPNVFGSVGLQVIPQASLVGSWTGNRLNLGVSVVPLKNIPLVINAIYTDVTDNLDFGSGLSIVAGSGFRF